MAYTKLDSGIYQILNIKNNKRYIGYSKNIQWRWSTHKEALKKQKHINIYLQSAWNKYGKDCFVFSILEKLPRDYSQKEFEEVETKWILLFNTVDRQFGYNICLPGVYTRNSNRKTSSRIPKKVICLNTLITYDSTAIAASELKLSKNKIISCCAYWTNKGKRSYKDLMFCYLDDYDSNFDYLNFKKIKPIKENKKTWRDYPPKKYKRVEKIIPYEERNIKRNPMIAVNCITGEELYFSSINSSFTKFLPSKVYKCLNNEFKKYSHRGFYFKRVLSEGSD